MPELEPESQTLEAILERRRKQRIGAVGGLLALGVLGAFGWWWLSSTEPAPAPPAPAPPIPMAKAPSPIPPPTPEEEVVVEELVVIERVKPSVPPLARLEASDPDVRDAAFSLSEHLAWAEFLMSEALIRQFVAAVDSIAEGRSPVGPLSVLRPRRPYRADWEGETIRVDPKTWRRYDPAGIAMSRLDAADAVALLETWRPRIDEAYRDLGYPERPFSDALSAALDQLLSAPLVEGLPLLVPEGVDYAYADPELEALSPAQKQLLRMGPENTRRVQSKLREIADQLGIPNDRLPRTSVFRTSSGD